MIGCRILLIGNLFIDSYRELIIENSLIPVLPYHYIFCISCSLLPYGSDRAWSVSRCWLLYYLCLCSSRWYEVLAVIWQISACRGQHGRIRHTSLSLSAQFSQEHYEGWAGPESLSTQWEDVKHDDEGPHWPTVRHNKVGSVLSSPHLQRPSVKNDKVPAQLWLAIPVLDRSRDTHCGLVATSCFLLTTYLVLTLGHGCSSCQRSRINQHPSTTFHTIQTR